MTTDEKIESDPIIEWLRALDERSYLPRDLIDLRQRELSRYEDERDRLLADVAYLKMRDGYTQRQLADDMDLSPQRINMILRGHVRSERHLTTMRRIIDRQMQTV